MDFEYDTGRPFPSANTTAKKLHVDIVSIKDNPDGSSNFIIDMSEDVRDALLRKAIVQALVEAAKKAEKYNVQDEQPEVSECGWPDETIRCPTCKCWKNG